MSSWWSKQKKPQIRALIKQLTNPKNPDPIISAMMRASTEKPRPFGESVETYNRKMEGIKRDEMRKSMYSPVKKQRISPPSMSPPSTSSPSMSPPSMLPVKSPLTLKPLSIKPSITPESERAMTKKLEALSSPTRKVEKLPPLVLKPTPKRKFPSLTLEEIKRKRQESAQKLWDRLHSTTSKS